MNKLDLHGVKHGGVRRLVIRFIEDNWDSGKIVEIITGHSQHMKTIVEAVLDEYKLEYNSTETFGYINMPRIRVEM